MIFSHKIRLVPTKTQENYFCQACGVSRFTYNWALDAWKKAYELGLQPSGRGLKKQFNSIRKKAYSWTYDVHRDCTAGAFDNLQNAFQHFFRRIKAGERPGYPRFKKKGRCRDSFVMANDKFKLRGKTIRIPRLGWVRMREELRFIGKILSATVSRIADYWFVAIVVETDVIPIPPKTKEIVGVDLGISTLATFSDNKKVKHSRRWMKLEQQVRMLQKRVSRKKKGSANRKKAVVKLARKHYLLRCLRQDILHKTTTELVRKYQVIVIEDLNIKGMVKNHHLARAISRQGWAEFRQQLHYKCGMHDRNLIIANRFFPSTKTCSSCGSIKSMHLSERIYSCNNCGIEIDRDINAAINLSKLPLGKGNIKPVEMEALAI